MCIPHGLLHSGLVAQHLSKNVGAAFIYFNNKLIAKGQLPQMSFA